MPSSFPPDDPGPESLTELLRTAHAGDRGAADRAYAALYPELRAIARARLRQHAPNTLLDTSGLVHESFLHLLNARRLTFEDRRHFYAYASKVMRNIVVDHARRRASLRRGGDAERVTLETGLGVEEQSFAVLDIDSALQSLERLDPFLARVVEMRYFGGHSDTEIAEALGVVDRSVRRYWEKARAILLVHMQS